MLPVPTKRCCVCGEMKEKTAFYVNRAAPSGRTGRCKDCWRTRGPRRPLCLICGQQFEVPLRRGVSPKICSQECYRERDNRRDRQERLRRRVPQVPHQCEVCETTFMAPAGRRHRTCGAKYCGHRLNLLRKKYDMTPQDFREMLENQDDQCASCGDPFESTALTHIDHCHDTGQVRGILCQRCNLALGHAQDDGDRLYSLVSYLARTVDLRDLCVQ